MMGAVADSIHQIAELGGPVVLILLVLSLLATAVALYKLWQFSAAGVGRHRALNEAVDAWDQGDRDAAHEALNRSQSYLAPIIRMSMTGQTDPQRAEAEAETRFSALETGFRLLDTIAQTAPLLGLFGTVVGMISAFQALQEAGTQVDPSILAGGIWVALLTTAAGLAVAMPTAMVLSWFEARMDRERVLAGRLVHTVLAPVAREAGTSTERHLRHA